MKILIVDDEPVFLETFESVLKKRGHQVDTAPNGERAMELIDGGVYDLAFLDFGMPDFTGLDVLEYLRKKKAKTFAVIMTAYPLDPASVEKAGADVFLNKPFSFDEAQKILSRATV